MNEHFGHRSGGAPLIDIPPLSRVLMVGAVRQPDGELSLTDRNLLRFGLQPLRDTGLPVAPDEEIALEVMNKADVFGGRDFLAESGVEADVVILCNIPHKMDRFEYENTHGTLRDSFVMGVEQLGHHELSPKHWDRDIWARKLKETGAKVIVSYGSDSMPLEEVMPDGYFHAKRLKTMPSSGLYVMDSQFVINLPFSQWASSHPNLNRFVIDSQFYDMPTDYLGEPERG